MIVALSTDSDTRNEDSPLHLVHLRLMLVLSALPEEWHEAAVLEVLDGAVKVRPDQPR